MASVLESYGQLPLRRHHLRFVGTWTPDARFAGLGPASRAALWMIRQRRHGPTISHLHLSEGGSFLREGGLAALASSLGNPVVESMHGADLAEFVAAHPRIATAVLGRADAVIALGPRTAELVRSAAPGVRVEIIPNPVEVPPTTPPLPEGPPTALFAGDVGTRKGVDVLIAAWPKVRASIPEARLVIAGGPDDLTVPSLPGVEVTGPVPRAAVSDLLESAQVAVLPSRREVMPMFLLEAMARGRGVVSTPAGDIEDLVGDAGLVVPIGDVDALADALADLMSSPSRCAELGGRARLRVETRFSPTVIGARLEAVYDSIA